MMAPYRAAQVRNGIKNPMGEDDQTVYDILNRDPNSPVKKEDLVEDFRKIRQNEGYNMTPELANEAVTQALPRLKKHGKAMNPSRGYWQAK